MRRVWAEDGGRVWDEEGMGGGWREGVGWRSSRGCEDLCSGGGWCAGCENVWCYCVPADIKKPSVPESDSCSISFKGGERGERVNGWESVYVAMGERCVDNRPMLPTVQVFVLHNFVRKVTLHTLGGNILAIDFQS